MKDVKAGWFFATAFFAFTAAITGNQWWGLGAVVSLGAGVTLAELRRRRGNRE